MRSFCGVGLAQEECSDRGVNGKFVDWAEPDPMKASLPPDSPFLAFWASNSNDRRFAIRMRRRETT